ncbi:hypothetical protein OFB92_36765, partial [Escherichia coli]|nr:hypothetical protein [Escherichia coli]
DAAASVLVCANGYFRRGKPVRMLADALAAADACESVQHVVVVDRLGNGSYEGEEPGGHYALRDYATLAATTPEASGD